MTWTPSDIPDLTGRRVVVTGPTHGGLGYVTALELARRGACVVLAGRSSVRLAEAEGAVRSEVRDAEVATVVLDLADLASVRRAAAEIMDAGEVDVLVNNAGIMATPRGRTADGLELQLGTNHFGPFLLTGLLLPALAGSGGGRVVTVSSIGHRMARSAPLGDPARIPTPYRPWETYGRTKLANLLFAYELDRRLRGAGLPVRSLAAHPGVSDTHLVANGKSFRWLNAIAVRGNALISQSPEMGARPTLMAATADLPGGTYVGPSGPLQWAGPPRVVTSRPLARDPEAARALWELSERVTGLSYP